MSKGDTLVIVFIAIAMFLLGMAVQRTLSTQNYPQGFLDGMREMSKYRNWLWEGDQTDEQIDSVIVAITNKANRKESPDDK